MKAFLLPAGLLLCVITTLADDPTAIPGLPPGGQTPNLPSLAERVAATKHLHVPLPSKTRFDTNPAARLAYRKAYRSGYRFAMAGAIHSVGDIHMIPTGNDPHGDAIIAGYHEGVDAGVAQFLKNSFAPATTN